MAKKSFSAKEFFDGIDKGTEKNDATRVERYKENPRESEEYAKQLGDMHAKNEEHEATAQRLDSQARMLRDAAKKGIEPKTHSNSGNPISKKRANEFIHGYEGAEDLEDCAAQQRGYKEAPNPKDKNEPKNGLKPYYKNSKYNDIGYEYEYPSEKRKKESEARAKTFEDNLHKYDREFDKMDTKKNPGGWAKSFFRDLHDKEVK